MFSDTHFHFSLIEERTGGEGYKILSRMAERNCKFGLDIGTKAGDLNARQNCVRLALNKIEDADLQKKASDFVYFSAGIWPDIEEIKNRVECVQNLENQISDSFSDDNQAENNASRVSINKKIIAIGEGGLDHHWNPTGADGRTESDFNDEIYKGEKELFEMQLALAKKMNLPMIVHSRDAFDDTVECIKSCGWNKGIIHCYSYGLEEARVFLDLGWYISFSGSVTYTKKSKYEDMKKLLSFVPEDRLLCETDAPYLAPVPMRGTVNTPILVEHTYNYIAQARGIEVEQLCETVDANAGKLFF